MTNVTVDCELIKCLTRTFMLVWKWLIVKSSQGGVAPPAPSTHHRFPWRLLIRECLVKFGGSGGAVVDGCLS